MKRITVDEVRNAYKKHGLHPKIGTIEIRPGLNYTCTIGALAVDIGLDCSNANDDLYDQLYERWGRDYVVGFYTGFDNSLLALDQKVTEEGMMGYTDGAACKCLLLEGL